MGTNRYRIALALAVAITGAGVVSGALLPWLTTFAGLQQYAAVDGLYGKVLIAFGAVLVIAAAVLLWRETVIGRWAMLAAALLATLLSGWMLVQAETLYATLAADVFTVAGRGPGGALSLISSVAATALSLVPLRAGGSVAGPGSPDGSTRVLSSGARGEVPGVDA